MSYFGSYFGGGQGGGDPELVSITSNGSISRWTPIVARVVIPAGNDLFIILKVGGNRFEIYDAEDGWIGMFQDRSSIEEDGDETVVTILPNGGWWSANFNILLISGKEVEP